ncbi:hypothetical protein [Lacticaseibacillus camelliae]|uniref:Prophage Lp1 protein 6 n=1 Tax=Lacticaseibacillus camelliae DSM 22697 = JCM 13995 TaxID=1423730 RepID=A0A0R2F9M1_9LACO|nr:hypothetical protein [Lacticaseibacillus camelliae]KRN25055.1 hypothetical protein FC75_GL000966 [Lacticaseibacillus camelliae DSM 22697 = JCM 13995]
MKTKSLILADGIYGLVAGVILLIAPLVITASAIGDVANGNTNTTSVWGILFFLLKLAALALGIYSLIYYKNSELVKPAAAILLIVGGGVALIPLLGWVGGIVIIVGGGIALANLKHFGTPAAN